MHLNNTADLLRAARNQRGGIKKPKSKLLKSYNELEHVGSDRASLGGVVELAFKGLNERDSVVALYHSAALKVAARIDVGDDGTKRNPYHNPVHFAKVVVNFRVLAAVHNQMVDCGIIKNQPKIENQDIAKGLFAAVAHDVCHDRTVGNMAKGVHTPFLLEQKSIDQAYDWTHVSSDKDNAHLMNALSLIHGTDVSGNPSPGSLVRAWHDHYFKNGSSAAHVPGISETLKPIIGDHISTLIASLLHDADILASVIDMEQHEECSQRFGEEAGKPPSPRSELYFLQDILNGRVTTDAAASLVGTFITDQIRRYQSAPQP